MYISKIRIQNFKSLKDTEFIIKPLTFLFGANSSGKSSFIKALNFFKMNFTEYAFSELNYEMDEISMINYKDIVFNNDIKLPIIYEFDIVKDLHENMSINNSKEICVRFIFRHDFEKDIEHLEKIEFIDFKTDSYLSQNFDEFRLYGNDESFDFLKTHFFEKPFMWGKDIYCRTYYKDTSHIIDEWNKYVNSEFYCKFNIDELRLIDYYDNNNQKQIKHHYNYVRELEKLFNKYSSEKKDDLYKKTIYVYNLFHYTVPNVFNNFLKSFHSPTTRNLIKPVYELVGNKFKKSDEINYYNFLNKYFREQNNLYSYTNLVPSSVSNIINEIEIKFNDIEILKEFKKLGYEDEDIHLILSDFVKYIKKNNIKCSEELLIKIKEDKLINLDESIEELQNSITEINENKLNNIINLIMKTRLFDYIENKDIMTIAYYVSSCMENYFIWTNYWLKVMGFDFKILIEKKDILGYLISVRNDDLNFKFNASNESSGFLQIFPVLIGLSEIMSGEIKTIMIEQPELHLHPKLQSELSIVFNDIVLLNDDKDFYIIVETHSEHIIRKTQVLIAKGDLDKKNIGVNYLYKENGETKVKKMIFEKNGFLKEPWPDGFFDESYNLSKELLFAREN